MKLSLIYARSENRCIGANGGLPWHLPDEFKHFKRTTMGAVIVMGRKTFEDHRSVLPGRVNVVLTRDADYPGPDGLLVRHNLDAVLDEFADRDEVYVIGGAGLFAEAFLKAGRVYETVVHAEVEGDTFLPPLDFEGWDATMLEQHPIDDRHAHAYTVTRYNRVK